MLAGSLGRENTRAGSGITIAAKTPSQGQAEPQKQGENRIIKLLGHSPVPLCLLCASSNGSAVFVLQINHHSSPCPTTWCPVCRQSSYVWFCPQRRRITQFLIGPHNRVDNQAFLRLGFVSKLVSQAWCCPAPLGQAAPRFLMGCLNSLYPFPSKLHPGIHLEIYTSNWKRASNSWVEPPQQHMVESPSSSTQVPSLPVAFL